ncbi:MAG: transglycosylase domain-containing protein [Eubacteriaceae bacterium]
MKKKIIVTIMLILAISLVIFGCTYSPVNLDDYEYKPKEKTVIYSTDDEMIGEIYNENRSYVSIDYIPQNLINGIIAVEDSRFYDHKGFDPIGIMRAMFTNLKKGEITEGASTITQQLVRNLFKEITTEKTFLRKINEALTAMQLEKKYTKNQILEMYLNEIYLGAGTYGMQEASKEYFGKDVWDLSLAECAMLAGLPQAPSAYEPNENFDLAKKRQEKVLERMADVGYISQEEAETAILEEISIIDEESKEIVGRYKDGYEAYINQVINEYCQYLKDQYDNEEITKEFALESLQNDGLTIYTTLNSKIQEYGLSALESGLKSHGIQGTATGAFVTIDSYSGSVLSYYGGNTEIDMAVKPRQPGSTIKPFIYSKAIEDGVLNVNTIILDEYTDFNGYKPKNSGNKYYGFITVREAIVNSINVPAVKIMNLIGVNTSLEFIKQFGITSITEKDYSLATALGGMTYGISPLEMSKAYGVFANSGVLTEVFFIDYIKDSNENVQYKHQYDEEDTKQILSPNTVKEINDVLIDVVSRGTGVSARNNYYTGGKTGTTTNNKDLWFVGYTGRLSTSIWIGNVDNKSVSGSSKYSAQVYGDYISKLLKNNLVPNDNLEKVTTYDDTEKILVLSPLAQNDFDSKNIEANQVISLIVPSDQISYFEDITIVKVTVDKETGLLFVEGKCPESNREEKYYLLGDEPKEECNSMHIIDKIEDFFDGDNDEGNNSTDLDENSIDDDNDSSDEDENSIDDDKMNESTDENNVTNDFEVN